MGPDYDVIMLVLLGYGIDKMYSIEGPILQMPVSCALTNALCSVSELLCGMSCVCGDKQAKIRSKVVGRQRKRQALRAGSFLHSAAAGSKAVGLVVSGLMAGSNLPPSS